MQILVTGAAGFIGAHVCRHLIARGDEVLGIDNLNDYYPVALKRARLERLGSRHGNLFTPPRRRLRKVEHLFREATASFLRRTLWRRCAGRNQGREG